MILIAGVGNIFAGDDAFGCEVAKRLATRALPQGVRVVDFGIRALDLAYALEECDAAVLVDAATRGGAPGTLYVVEPDTATEPFAATGGHALDPNAVLRMARGKRCQRIVLVGCEPQTLEADDFVLSAPVTAAIEPALGVVERLANQLLQEQEESHGDPRQDDRSGGGRARPHRLRVQREGSL